VTKLGAGKSLESAPRRARRSESTNRYRGEASLRGHLKAEGAEEMGSQPYVPLDEKDDRALKVALNFLRRATTDVAFPPNPKAVPKQWALPRTAMH
jgi:hypothetical protein